MCIVFWFVGDDCYSADIFSEDLQEFLSALKDENADLIKVVEA